MTRLICVLLTLLFSLSGSAIGANSDFDHFCKAANTGASSAINKVKLEKQLASEEQLGQLSTGRGTVISQPAKQAERIARQTGRDAKDIQKVSSDARTAGDGQHIQTHTFRDASDNTLIEPKTILDPTEN